MPSYIRSYFWAVTDPDGGFQPKDGIAEPYGGTAHDIISLVTIQEGAPAQGNRCYKLE